MIEVRAFLILKINRIRLLKSLLRKPLSITNGCKTQYLRPQLVGGSFLNVATATSVGHPPALRFTHLKIPRTGQPALFEVPSLECPQEPARPLSWFTLLEVHRTSTFQDRSFTLTGSVSHPSGPFAHLLPQS